MSEKRSDGAYVRIYNRKEFVMAMTLHMNTDQTIDAIIAADRASTTTPIKNEFEDLKNFPIFDGEEELALGDYLNG